jgi:hypothetical protein
VTEGHSAAELPISQQSDVPAGAKSRHCHHRCCSRRCGVEEREPSRTRLRRYAVRSEASPSSNEGINGLARWFYDDLRTRVVAFDAVQASAVLGHLLPVVRSPGQRCTILESAWSRRTVTGRASIGVYASCQVEPPPQRGCRPSNSRNTRRRYVVR